VSENREHRTQRAQVAAPEALHDQRTGERQRQDAQPPPQPVVPLEQPVQTEQGDVGVVVGEPESSGGDAEGQHHREHHETTPAQHSVHGGVGPPLGQPDPPGQPGQGVLNAAERADPATERVADQKGGGQHGHPQYHVGQVDLVDEGPRGQPGDERLDRTEGAERVHGRSLRLTLELVADGRGENEHREAELDEPSGQGEPSHRSTACLGAGRRLPGRSGCRRHDRSLSVAAATRPLQRSPVKLL